MARSKYAYSVGLLIVGAVCLRLANPKSRNPAQRVVEQRSMTDCLASEAVVVVKVHKLREMMKTVGGFWPSKRLPGMAAWLGKSDQAIDGVVGAAALDTRTPSHFFGDGLGNWVWVFPSNHVPASLDFIRHRIGSSVASTSSSFETHDFGQGKRLHWMGRSGHVVVGYEVGPDAKWQQLKRCSTNKVVVGEQPPLENASGALLEAWGRQPLKRLPESISDIRLRLFSKSGTLFVDAMTTIGTSLDKLGDATYFRPDPRASAELMVNSDMVASLSAWFPIDERFLATVTGNVLIRWFKKSDTGALNCRNMVGRVRSTENQRLQRTCTGESGQCTGSSLAKKVIYRDGRLWLYDGPDIDACTVERSYGQASQSNTKYQFVATAPFQVLAQLLEKAGVPANQVLGALDSSIRTARAGLWLRRLKARGLGVRAFLQPSGSTSLLVNPWALTLDVPQAR